VVVRHHPVVRPNRHLFILLILVVLALDLLAMLPTIAHIPYQLLVLLFSVQVVVNSIVLS
jgi:hypothetical protein